MATKSVSKYVGDAALVKMMETYGSTVPFHVVRMRVLGALASPNKDLLPVAVIASFWGEEDFPKFARKDEGEAFFSNFMGLWRRLEKEVVEKQVKLSPIGKLKTLQEAKDFILKRVEELDAGFIEGFWGGEEDLAMPSATAALIDGISEEVEALALLMEEIEPWGELSEQTRSALREEIKERDTLVEDAIGALLILKHKGSSSVN